MSGDIASYVAGRVVEDGGCLRWLGALSNRHPRGTFQGKRFLVRRALFELEHGPIPPGKVLRCSCEIRGCVNLQHATLTTRQAVAQECGALGLMGGVVRSARIAATKRMGPQAKVTQADVEEIRRSDEIGSVVAARFGITQSTVSKYRLHKSRRDIAGNPWAALQAGAQSREAA